MTPIFSTLGYGHCINVSQEAKVETFDRTSQPTSFGTEAINESHLTPYMVYFSEDLTDKLKFNDLVQRWHDERGATSSISDMILCESYQKIIGMGQRAVPLIIDRLRIEIDDPDHWFAGLAAITCKDPVPESAYGDTVKMAEAWLAWAETDYAW